MLQRNIYNLNNYHKLGLFSPLPQLISVSWALAFSKAMQSDFLTQKKKQIFVEQMLGTQILPRL